jgi:hypothetical protein
MHGPGRQCTWPLDGWSDFETLWLILSRLNLFWFVCSHTTLFNLPVKHYSSYQPNMVFLMGQADSVCDRWTAGVILRLFGLSYLDWTYFDLFLLTQHHSNYQHYSSYQLNMVFLIGEKQMEWWSRGDNSWLVPWFSSMCPTPAVRHRHDNTRTLSGLLHNVLGAMCHGCHSSYRLVCFNRLS